ncbi:hypothetical protein G4177_06920 [Corallococcus sp. ZKHCc1 1396]|uniref:Uncharacterized protein n=1 Tax=Corallococcus soli TaxID=2710757 RepID=A0ABR9PJ57_9BACT|nr:hypothetical protein [Corallococcus soli]MBE4747910.1 hypothetical protein [Corallococcus soli]
MDTSKHPDFLEILQRANFDFNPFFHTISQEIHLPFSYEDYRNSVRHQASFLHEYTHLVQALSTTYGVYSFVGLSERFALFFNAVQGRAELSFPIVEWASHEVDDEALGAFAKYESHYQVQRAASDGTWKVAPTVSGDDFSLCQESKDVGGKLLKRWHVVRRTDVGAVAIPLLGVCLSEAQAECVAAYFYDSSSELLEREDRKQDEKSIIYTSVNGLVRRLLPNYPTLEATYFLTEYALMTYVPDVAFVRGIEFLEKRSPPTTIGEWNSAWMDLDNSLDGYGKKSVDDLLNGIDRKIALFGRYVGNIIVELLVHRLMMCRSLVLLKSQNPFQFFPWERTTEWLERELLQHIPVTAAHFTDGIHALGSPRPDDIQKQATLSAVAFLLAVLREKKPAECPRFASASCTAVRTLDCKQFPWGRGDVGGGRTCLHGALGIVLGIASSSLSSVSARYKP